MRILKNVLYFVFFPIVAIFRLVKSIFSSYDVTEKIARRCWNCKTQLEPGVQHKCLTPGSRSMTSEEVKGWDTIKQIEAAPARYSFSIDVGKMDTDKANEFIKDVKAQVSKGLDHKVEIFYPYSVEDAKDPDPLKISESENIRVSPEKEIETWYKTTRSREKYDGRDIYDIIADFLPLGVETEDAQPIKTDTCPYAIGTYGDQFEKAKIDIKDWSEWRRNDGSVRKIPNNWRERLGLPPLKKQKPLGRTQF